MSENRVKSANKVEFDSLGKSDKLFTDFCIDDDRPKIRKSDTIDKELIEKENKEKEILKGMDKILTDIGKLQESFYRYNNSDNKKNTEFMKNNLKKIIGDSSKLLDLIQ